MKTEDKFPHNVVLSKMRSWFTACFVVTFLIFIASWYQFDVLTALIIIGIFLLVLLGFAALLYASAVFTWRRTPVGEQRYVYDSVKAKRNEKIENTIKSWYVRYPIAIVLCLSTFWLAQRANSTFDWLGVAAMIIWVIVTAYEVALLLVFIGIIAMLWSIMAGLTVQGAIIFGAVIIAYALHSALSRSNRE